MNEEFSDQGDAAAPLEVMLVDDESLNLRVLQRMLRHESYHLELCRSGDEAVELARSRYFDIILMDIMMPGISGLEACGIIHEHIPDLPIIIMTAIIDESVVQEAFECGAADYLRKPLNQKELVVRINNCVGIRRANAKTRELYNHLLRDVEAAAGIQKCLMPDRMICSSQLDFYSIYQPAEKLSGDVFDLIPGPHDCSLIYIGDISGHGVQSAMLTAAVKTLIRLEAEYVDEDFDFRRAARNIVRRLGQLFLDKYMTFLLGCFNPASGELEYINCGHLPLLHYSPRDHILRQLADDGVMPVGLRINDEEMIPPLNRIVLQDGEMLFWYT
ncbi:MAG: response regulator, partial [Victivallales bacterium]|nr:response regulator [Victivallales bacterium]